MGLLLSLFLVTGQTAFGLSSIPVTLAWNSSGDPGVAGYAIYYGPTNSPTHTRMDVGNTLMATVAGLNAGEPYKFYVVAYDFSGTESIPSNPLTYSPPAMSKVQCLKTGNTQVAIQFRTSPGAPCRIQYTETLVPIIIPPSKYAPGTNYIPWQILKDTAANDGGVVTVTDNVSSSTVFRFYRAVRY